MTQIDPQSLWALDRKYAEQGIAFHARPLRAARDILGSKFAMGQKPFGNPDVEKICQAYRQLIPEVGVMWPGAGTGIAASIDQVVRVTVPVVFGTVDIPVFQALGFKTEPDWQFWCRQDRNIVAGSCYAFADILDFSVGLSGINDKGSDEYRYWIQAASNLEAVADSLSHSYRTNSVLQPICMAAELSMKAALLHFGVSLEDLRSPKKFGHKLENLLNELKIRCPHHDDDLISSLMAAFPDYVQSRYDDAGLTRLQIVRLALGSQFIAASAMRRLGMTNYASEMQLEVHFGKRTF